MTSHLLCPCIGIFQRESLRKIFQSGSPEFILDGGGDLRKNHGKLGGRLVGKFSYVANKWVHLREQSFLSLVLSFWESRIRLSMHESFTNGTGLFAAHCPAVAGGAS